MKRFSELWLDTTKPFAVGAFCIAVVYGFARIVRSTLVGFSLSEDAAETTAGVVLCVLGVFTFIAFLRWEEERHQSRKDKE